MKLVLFFTAGVSLETWDSVGMLSREVALYKRMMKKGLDVAFVTYGTSDHLKYSSRLEGIEICCNRWSLPIGMYKALLPFLHRKVYLSADLVKTNQVDGGEVAARVAERYSLPLISRCGYMWSEFQRRRFSEGSRQVLRSEYLERLVFRAGNAIVVTTEDMKESVARRLPRCESRVRVIPNYVDTNQFVPSDSRPKVDRLCYVGQLKQQQKNPKALLEAVRGLDLDLDIIGEGNYRQEIEDEAKANQRIRIHGRVAHEKLPSYLQKATVFVFPSFFEGHPKALIEAMSCGLPVVTTDVPGISNVITHGKNGWLCKTDAASLREGIMKVVSDKKLADQLGEKARQYVLDNYSLDKVAQKELMLYETLLEEGSDR